MSRRPTITLSDDLREAAEILLKRHKIYRSLREFIESLIRYEALAQKEHHVTGEWASLSGIERDALDAAILRHVKSGEGQHGSYLEAEVRRAVAELQMSGVDPTTKAVAKKIAKRIVEQSD